jgi:hypothetical protein
LFILTFVFVSLTKFPVQPYFYSPRIQIPPLIGKPVPPWGFSEARARAVDETSPQPDGQMGQRTAGAMHEDGTVLGASQKNTRGRISIALTGRFRAAMTPLIGFSGAFRL